jgi:uncharacterized repeat protein (TIGR01451 family)
LGLSLRHRKNAAGTLKLLARAVATYAVLCALSDAARAETLNWTYPGVNVPILNSSSSTTINGVTVQTSAARAGSFDSSTATILFNGTSNGSAAGILSMRQDASAVGASQTTTITFSEPVYNLSFTVRDIDGGPTYVGNWNDIANFTSDNGFPSANPASGVSYAAGTGQATAINNANTTGTSGNITVTFAGPVNTLSVQHVSGPINSGSNPAEQVIYIDDLTFLRRPRLTVQKSYSGGTGNQTFNFNISNSGSGTTATSVTTSGPAVTGTQITLSQISTATTITETGPAGWVISPAAVTCTDSNSLDSGNPPSFPAAVAGNAVSIPAGNVRAGAVITCPLSNARLPTLQIRKTTTNGTGSFTFTGNNGFDTEVLATTAVSTPVSGTVQALDTPGLVTTITDGIPDSGWAATSATCTGTAAGNVSFDTTTRELTLNATATAVNTNLVCTFTNDDVAPRLTLAKTVTNDNGGTASAGAFTLAAAGTTPLSGAAGSSAVTTRRVVAGTYTLSETGPSGYAASAWSCPGETVTGGNSIALSNGESRTCTIINNDIAPTLQLRKISNGGVSTFNFSGTNGFGADSINTVPAGAGNPQNGVVKTLTLGGSATDITETVASGYFISAAPTCTGMGSGGAISLVSGTTYKLNAAALPIGATVVCTFVNTLAAPALSLLKTPSPTVVNAAGQTVNYTLAVTNSGNVPVTSINVSDALGTVICPTSGNATIAALAAGATENCIFAYVVPQSVLNDNGGGDGDIDNTAIANGTYISAPVSASGLATVTVTQSPQLSMLKSWGFAPSGDINGNGTADVNDVVVYTYSVTNSGNLTVNNVTVTDVHEATAVPSGSILNEALNPGGSPASTDAAPNNGVWSVLQPGDTVSFKYQHIVTQAEVDNG